MKKLILYAVGFLFMPMMAMAATYEKELTLDDLTKVDSLGYICIDETDLDAAFLVAGKGERLPQTCIFDKIAMDCDVAAEYKGAPLDYDECARFKNAWMKTWTPEVVRFTQVDCWVNCYKTPTAVPLPAAGALLAVSVGALLLFKRYRS